MSLSSTVWTSGFWKDMFLICFREIFISEISVSSVVVVAGFAKSRLRSKEATMKCKKSREAFSKLFIISESNKSAGYSVFWMLCNWHRLARMLPCPSELNYNWRINMQTNIDYWILSFLWKVTSTFQREEITMICLGVEKCKTRPLEV